MNNLTQPMNVYTDGTWLGLIVTVAIVAAIFGTVIYKASKYKPC